MRPVGSADDACFVQDVDGGGQESAETSGAAPAEEGKTDDDAGLGVTATSVPLQQDAAAGTEYQDQEDADDFDLYGDLEDGGEEKPGKIGQGAVAEDSFLPDDSAFKPASSSAPTPSKQGDAANARGATVR